MYIFVTAVSVALVVSFLCSIFESVLLSIRPSQVELLVSAGHRSGRLLKGFKQKIDVPIAAILIVNTIAHTVGATVAGASYVEVFSEQSLWIFSAAFTVSVLLFTEIIPKTLGVAFTDVLATPVAHAIHWLTVLLGPLVTLTSKISRGIRGSKRTAATSIEEIRLLTAVGRQEGVVGGGPLPLEKGPDVPEQVGVCQHDGSRPGSAARREDEQRDVVGLRVRRGGGRAVALEEIVDGEDRMTAREVAAAGDRRARDDRADPGVVRHPPDHRGRGLDRNGHADQARPPDRQQRRQPAGRRPGDEQDAVAVLP